MAKLTFSNSAWLYQMVWLLLFSNGVFSQVFTDQASNYSGNWPNSSNEGSGFGPWVTQSQSNTGRFIGNPANDGMGTAGIGTTAFGMWATSSTNYSTAYRPFSESLDIGDEFSFYWVLNWDANTGSKGFVLRSGSTSIFSITNFGSASIQSTQGRASDSYGVLPMHVRLFRMNATQYLFQMTRRNSNGGAYTAVFTTALPIDGIQFFIGAQSGSEGMRNMYFNHFKITKGLYTAPIPNFVIHQWSGALTPFSIQVKAKLALPTSSAQLLVSTSPDLSMPLVSEFVSVDASTHFMGSFNVSGLQPQTSYYYGISSSGVLDARPEAIGRFRTPASGPHSFSFTAGACNTNSTGPVFQRILEKSPLFMLAHGDLHYADPNSSQVLTHRLPYEERILSITPTRDLFRNVPIAYVWDDHDFSGDNSNAASIGASSAKQAYREYVPHYPFGTGISQANSSIYQSFVIGRVRFLLTDLRSEMTPTYIMSPQQEQWFKDSCLAAKAAGEIICWVSSFGITSDTSDSWGGTAAYRNQRSALFQFLNENQIANLFVISGDAHASGIDDGANTDCSGVFSDHRCPRFECSQNPNYPLLHAAGLYNTVSIKGVVTNIVPMTGINYHGQYAKVDVTDTGTSEIGITFTLYRVHPDTGVETTLGSYSFTRTLTPTEENRVLIPSQTSWKYLDNGSNQGTIWVQPQFNDSSWVSGTSPLGYGMTGVSTPISFGPNPNSKYITSYFRKAFTLSQLSELRAAWAELWLDDGAVVYLNGVEIGRAHLPTTSIDYLTPATTVVGQTPSYVKFCLPDLSLFQEGENVVAVEVHQHSGTSSDLYFDFRMIGNFTPTLNETDMVTDSLSDGFYIYPNPVRDTVKIRFQYPGLYTHLRLYDLQGKKLVEQVLTPSHSEFDLDMKAYTSGVYLIELSRFSYQVTKRILKDY
ncbi:alkaline phosphatase D family protein [Flavobacterium sp.]|uniref:alkaline phosphatase D family protein n=1 Tax=Flavobacterium sp. TaxID=239 RepID=UPI002FDA3BB4